MHGTILKAFPTLSDITNKNSFNELSYDNLKGSNFRNHINYPTSMQLIRHAANFNLTEEKRIFKQKMMDKNNIRERRERSRCNYFKENHDKMNLLKKYGIDTVGAASR